MSLVIIIGLPGSGKSHLCRELQQKNYKIHDDFISNFYDGKAVVDMKEIARGRSVCLADPRLCIWEIFCSYIDKILSIVDRACIKIILFENDPYYCILNVHKRGYNKNIIDKILKYSHHYYLHRYFDYDYEIRSIWK